MDHTVFFFNDTATTEIYTLSLHDALPISVNPAWSPAETEEASAILAMDTSPQFTAMSRSEAHTSELQSQSKVAFRRLLDTDLSVVVTTWTEAEAPAARVAGP